MSRACWYALAFAILLPAGAHALKCKRCTRPVCKWAGVYPTVLTPFCGCEGGIDTCALERQVRYQLQHGVHGLLVLGTFGEGQYCTMKEREQVIATSVRCANGCVPVVAGIHTCNLHTAQSQVVQAKELGASAVLVKYIGNTDASPQQVYDFVAYLSAMNVLPIFYYHYPAQTKMDLTSTEIAAILSLPNVIGIKETVLDLAEVERHHKACEGMNKIFMSSTMLNITQFLDMGGHGAMCAEAALFPGPCVQTFGSYTAGQHREARRLQKEFFKLAPVMRNRPTSPIVACAVLMPAEDCQIPLPMTTDQPQAKMKYALCRLGVPTPVWVKCPLPKLNICGKMRVRDCIGAMNKIDWDVVAADVPPVPYKSHVNEGGFLLQTGAFQLGPGVGKNMIDSQWDGKGGFFE